MSRSWNCPWMSPHTVTGELTGCTLLSSTSSSLTYPHRDSSSDSSSGSHCLICACGTWVWSRERSANGSGIGEGARCGVSRVRDGMPGRQIWEGAPLKKNPGRASGGRGRHARRGWPRGGSHLGDPSVQIEPFPHDGKSLALFPLPRRRARLRWRCEEPGTEALTAISRSRHSNNGPTGWSFAAGRPAQHPAHGQRHGSGQHRRAGCARASDAVHRCVRPGRVRPRPHLLRRRVRLPRQRPTFPSLTSH